MRFVPALGRPENEAGAFDVRPCSALALLENLTN
jgi:hypothetical protein